MKQVCENVFYCGVPDCDRKIFDELIGLPIGTSYNSYLVKGSKKTALIDTSYVKKIEEFVKDIPKIDYIIANHAEGDHTGALTKILEMYPDSVIVTNEKCKELLIDAYSIPFEKFKTVKDDEEISLGDKTLQFFLAPFVHWPDTMFTYLKEDNVLFTCDFLGAHHPFCDDMFVGCNKEYLKEARRYYGEIMMPFRVHIKKYLQKVREIDPKIICPSHGKIYDEPKLILDAYENWTCDNGKNKVVIPYVSMYNNTFKMVEFLKDELEKNGVEVEIFDLVSDDLGEYISSIVDATTIVFGASMVLSNPHPYAVLGAFITNVLKPNVKFISIIGSYGWGGKLTQKLEENLTNLKSEKLDYVIVKGAAKCEDFEKLKNLAIEIKKRHKEVCNGFGAK